MLESIRIASCSDARLSRLTEQAQEYARVYIFAKQRQKGCDGLGEMNNLKDEFRSVLDELLEYCKEKRVLDINFDCDLDILAEELERFSVHN